MEPFAIDQPTTCTAGIGFGDDPDVIGVQFGTVNTQTLEKLLFLNQPQLYLS